MRVRSTLRFLRALLATNLKASFALRGAFWMQAVFMLANDLIFFTVWWIFFARFESIGGWRLPDMMRLYAVLAGAFGAAVVLGGGVRELARTISDGDLDAFLTQPKHPLVHVVASKTNAAGWGDLANCALLLSLSGTVTLASIPLVLVAVAAGAVVFVSVGVLFHSAAFWLGPVQTLARQMWEFLITFACYPDTLFAGGLRVLLFTALPAAFVGWLPAGLVADFTWGRLAGVVLGALGFAALAVLVFHAGLRRYASGNRFGVRA